MEEETGRRHVGRRKGREVKDRSRFRKEKEGRRTVKRMSDW